MYKRQPKVEFLLNSKLVATDAVLESNINLDLLGSLGLGDWTYLEIAERGKVEIVRAYKIDSAFVFVNRGQDNTEAECFSRFATVRFLDTLQGMRDVVSALPVSGLNLSFQNIQHTLVNGVYTLSTTPAQIEGDFPLETTGEFPNYQIGEKSGFTFCCKTRNTFRPEDYEPLPPPTPLTVQIYNFNDGLTVNYSAYYNGGVYPIYYAWDFGDGTTIQSTLDNSQETHTYAAAGTYQATVSLIDSLGETASAGIPVTVVAPVPPPVPDFTWQELANGTLRFTDTSTGLNRTFVTFNYGDGFAGNVDNNGSIDHQYEINNSYLVTMILYYGNNQQVYIQKTVEVTTAPEVIEYYPVLGYERDELVVTFTDTATDTLPPGITIDSYNIDLGDEGTFENVQLPFQYTYTAPGYNGAYISANIGGRIYYGDGQAFNVFGPPSWLPEIGVNELLPLLQREAASGGTTKDFGPAVNPWSLPAETINNCSVTQKQVYGSEKYNKYRITEINVVATFTAINPYISPPRGSISVSLGKSGQFTGQIIGSGDTVNLSLISTDVPDTGYDDYFAFGCYVNTFGTSQGATLTFTSLSITVEER